MLLSTVETEYDFARNGYGPDDKRTGRPSESDRIVAYQNGLINRLVGAVEHITCSCSNLHTARALVSHELRRLYPSPGKTIATHSSLL